MPLLPHLPLCGMGRIVPSGLWGLTREGSPLPWVVGARGTPQDAAQRGCPGKCVCSPALDTAHTSLCSHTQAHMCTHVHMHTCVCTCCVLLHTHAHVHVYTHVLVYMCSRVHTRAHMLTAHSHHVWACSHALVHTCALTHSSAHVPTHTPPVQPYMRTHTFTACALTPHTHTLTRTY